MENTTMIRALKEKIKTLSAEQKLLKMARKTTMPKDQWEAIRLQLLQFKQTPSHWIPVRGKDWLPQHAALEASIQSDKITACLNYYHELRGSVHRHGKSQDNYWQSKYMAELKAELKS